MARPSGRGMVPITVSFTHAHLDVLEDLATERGCSMSAIVRDLVARSPTVAAATAGQADGGKDAGKRAMPGAASPE